MFYSKNNQNKLIQNMVFEFVDDNLESLIERNVKAQTRIEETVIKVDVPVSRNICINCSMGWPGSTAKK